MLAKRLNILLHTFNFIRLAIAHSPRRVLQSHFRHRALPGVSIASAFTRYDDSVINLIWHSLPISVQTRYDDRLSPRRRPS